MNNKGRSSPSQRDWGNSASRLQSPVVAEPANPATHSHEGEGNAQDDYSRLHEKRGEGGQTRERYARTVNMTRIRSTTSGSLNGFARKLSAPSVSAAAVCEPSAESTRIETGCAARISCNCAIT
jgi:hypothetical protein